MSYSLDDGLYTMANLASIHSAQNSFNSLETKNAISNAIFMISDDIYDPDNERPYIITKSKTLYYWSQEKIEDLKVISINEHKELYLCTSLQKDAFNYRDLNENSNKKYKYFYKITLKDNTYGIFINKIYSTLNKDYSLAYNGNHYSNEQEVLIKLSDIGMFKLLRII